MLHRPQLPRFGMTPLVNTRHSSPSDYRAELVAVLSQNAAIRVLEIFIAEIIRVSVSAHLSNSQSESVSQARPLVH
jgi:hypothetical protein